MLILAMDTSLGACSVALYDATAKCVLASDYLLMDKGHAEVLGPMVERVLQTAKCKPVQLARIGVTLGPGTFTGVRIGLSFAKGMAQALGIPLIGIDTMSATAVPHFGSARHLAIVHRAGDTGKFYVGLYDGAINSLIGPPEVLSAAEIHEKLKGQNWLLAGTGAPSIAVDGNGLLVATTHMQPSAELFVATLTHTPANAPALEPIYLREPDAKPSVADERALSHVRLAGTDDYNMLASIHAQCFDTAWTAEQFQSALSLPGAQALVVELDQSAYGFVQFQQVLEEAEINTLCVLPNFRRQYFASDLLQKLFAHLLEGNVSRIFLEVAADNAGALSLYETHDFQRSGLRKSYYRRSDGTMEDAVTMARALDQNR